RSEDHADRHRFRRTRAVRLTGRGRRVPTERRGGGAEPGRYGPAHFSSQTRIGPLTDCLLLRKEAGQSDVNRTGSTLRQVTTDAAELAGLPESPAACLFLD